MRARSSVVAIAATLALFGTATVPAWGQETQAKAYPTDLSTNVPVIYVHGFTKSGGVGVDCSSTFADMFNALANWGHTGGHYTVSYYQNDTSCWHSLNHHGRHTTGHYGSGGHVGVNSDTHDQNASIRHLAYHLAWFVHDHFTYYNRYVKLVGHSMGGLIIRYALAKVEQGASDFPYMLLVHDAVTMGTPHRGSGLSSFCDWWYAYEQCKEMEEGSPFMTWLAQNASHPDGYPSTDWTAMAAHDDDVVAPTSAVGMAADHEVRYFSGQAIEHGDYMHRTSDYRSADVEWKDGTSPWKHWYSAPWPVRWAYYALAHYRW